MRRIIPPWNLCFIPALLVRAFLYAIVRVTYGVSAMGRNNVPANGGVLLVSNHISYVDILLLQVAYPRYIHFMAHKYLFGIWWLGWVLRMMGTIEIDPDKPRKGIQEVVSRLRRGGVACVFPEGAISRTGCLERLKPGIGMIARQAQCPIQPVFIDGIWGSVFSFKRYCFFGKRPLPYRHSIRVNIGAPIESGEEILQRTRLALLDLGEEAFFMRPGLDEHFARRVVRALARQPWRRQVVDTHNDRRELSRGKLLGAAIAYSRHLRKTVPGKRIAVALPPGAGATLANLAIIIAGKVPVNINFTAGKAATEASYRRGKITTIITASALEERLQDFPWPENKIDLPVELKALKKTRILWWVALAFLLPGRVLALLLGLPRHGGDKEAALLFTSGSSGEPKGVVLTHRNILANTEQISAVNFLLPTDSFLASLPVFHSFGFTVTLWYPILEGIPMVTTPSPLEARKVAEAVCDEKPTALFGTPSFFRPYVKKVDRHEFSSLRITVAGAEKLPRDLRETFEEKFGIVIMEGYGLTETAPVVSANMPDPPFKPREARVAGERAGSVGRLFPGMTARIVSEESCEQLSLYDDGVLVLKGANVFPGYLDDSEATAKAFHNGWFVTGDVARFDDDGFIFIEGRVSRFTKLGGEKVPHGTVEEKIREVMNLSPEQVEFVVMGVRDQGEREHLVALSSVDLSRGEMIKRLRAAKAPNLWIPDQIFRVERIPLLGSGKLDLKNCQRLADEHWERVEAGEERQR